jgi:long-chain acyl-CoA synthetase
LCLDSIARYKRPRTYYFVDSLPKNNYGKVLKTALRERLRDPSVAREAVRVSEKPDRSGA